MSVHNASENCRQQWLGHDFGCCSGTCLQELNKSGKTLEYRLYGNKFEPRATQIPNWSAVHSTNLLIFMLLRTNIPALSSEYILPVGLCVFFYIALWHLTELNIVTTKMEVRYPPAPSKQTPSATRCRGPEE